jgi:hypothetical protein
MDSPFVFLEQLLILRVLLKIDLMVLASCESLNSLFLATFANAIRSTFKDPAIITPADPDPNQMVPLLVGDYVTVSGTEIGGTLWVNNLVANLGIFTAAGTKPAYVTCEEVNFGIINAASNAGLGEIAETRAVAWTTDVGGGQLDWFAQDIDPCTGVITERSLNVPNQPNTATAPLGRAVYRSPGKADLTPATRNVGFRLSNGITKGAGNLTAGEFIQPVFNYIFPELLTIGTPMIVQTFDVIPYLAAGSGPYVPGSWNFPAPPTPVIVGQLSPWPGASAPATTVCPPPATGTPLPPTSTTAPPTSTTSACPKGTSTNAATKDTITITSATAKNQKGVATLSVTATTTSKDPCTLLSITATGQNPVGLTAMTLVAPGSWSFTITVKNKPLTVTVTSNLGGTATSNVN